MNGGRKRLGPAAAGAAVLGASATALYPVLWRRRCLAWGTIGDEATRALPGDDLLPHADIRTTRAITIDAPPVRIWPWLVQMGSGRGGAYSYDWLENLLGLDMHSADRIMPEFQDLDVGDELSLGGNSPRLRVELLKPEQAMVVRSVDGQWVWAFVIDEYRGASRLISRNRIATPGASWPVRVFNLVVMEPGSLVMERKMLLGIKYRAETRW